MADAVRRIGVLGGTFDPPHNGHLAIAVAAAHHLRLHRTLLVVANEPWQKVGERPISDPADRLGLTRAAIADVDPSVGLEVSSIEVERGGATYTADTLAVLRDADPDTERWLIVGADVALTLDSWERPDEVKSLAGLAVFDRGGVEAPISALCADGWDARHLPVARMDVRSTDVRAMVAAGTPIDGLVPPGSIREIARRGLYAEPR